MKICQLTDCEKKIPSTGESRIYDRRRRKYCSPAHSTLARVRRHRDKNRKPVRLVKCKACKGTGVVKRKGI